jgi:hypothetical protein
MIDEASQTARKAAVPRKLARTPIYNPNER